MIRKFYMADTEVGVRLSAQDDATPKVKNLKQELKLAQQEVITLSEKFGVTSKEAANAARKAAELQDSIGDAKSLIDAFNPDTKFRAFGASINTVVGGFTALTGVMGLLGVESEQVQKTLLKVQSALAISQGVAQLQEGVQSFKNLLAVVRGAINPITAIIGGIVAAGVVWLNSLNRQTAAQKALNSTLGDYKSAAAGAIQKVNEVKVAFDQARTGVISKEQALKVYNDTLGDSFGRTNDLGKAEKFLADKAEAYIQITALKAQANALFAKSAEQTAEALVAQNELINSGLSGEGGVFSRAADEIQAKIDAAKRGAIDIKNLGADLLRQAGDLAKSSGINIGPTVSTPRVAEKAKEVKQLDTLERDWQALLQRLRDEEYAKERERSARAIADLEANRDKRVSIGTDLLNNNSFLAAAQTQIDANNTAARIALAEQEADAKIAAARAIAGALGALSELIGKQTAAGKVLGIAQATINTWIGVTEVLRAKSTLPEPFGTIAKIANVVTVIATGLNAVKQIVKTQVPGYSASGGGGGAVSAPLQPAIPQATNTLLNQSQLNQIGNATVRAFVVETDVANNQERIRRINRAARI